MENYFKGKNVEEEIERSKIPFKDIPENFLWMQVKGGSKMTNLISHATGILEDKATTAIVWTGAGVAIAKAISCAEILKRQFSIQHQVTTLTYKSVEEYWEPKLDGLETIIVKRQIPVIHILLSLQEISDVNQLGCVENFFLYQTFATRASGEKLLRSYKQLYQSPLSKKFWEKVPSSNSKQQQSFKAKKSYKQRKIENQE